MLTTLTPGQLLALARRLLDGPDAGSTGVWPRAGALLVRQALELAMQRLWQLRAPGLEHAPARTQLLCLRVMLGDRMLAGEAGAAWWGLTQVCHFQPYDLPPTDAELRGWVEAAARLAASVERLRGAAGLDAVSSS